MHWVQIVHSASRRPPCTHALTGQSLHELVLHKIVWSCGSALCPPSVSTVLLVRTCRAGPCRNSLVQLDRQGRCICGWLVHHLLHPLLPLSCTSLTCTGLLLQGSLLDSTNYVLNWSRIQHRSQTPSQLKVSIFLVLGYNDIIV